MDIDDIKGIPLNEITRKKRRHKYSDLIDYVTTLIDDGMAYPFDEILRRYLPTWIEGFEETSPIKDGFYDTLRTNLSSYLRNHNIYLSGVACENYECGYAVVFYSKPLKKRDNLKNLGRNEELEPPSAVGKLTKKQLKELDFE